MPSTTRSAARAASIVLLLLVAGCHKKPKADDAYPDPSFTPPVVNAIGGPRPSPTPPPIASNVAKGLIAPSFPEGMQGRWGMTTKDCDLSRNDAFGRLVINPRRLVLFDQGWELKAIAFPAPGHVEVDLRRTDIEHSAAQHMSLMIGGASGNKLQRIDRDPMKSYTYTRCPA